MPEQEGKSTKGTLCYPVFGWPVFLSYSKTFHYTLMIEHILCFFFFFLFLIFDISCDVRHATTNYTWDYCLTYGVVASIGGNTWCLICLVLALCFSYIVRVQARDNLDLDTMRWRVDFWFVFRTFTWL